MAVTLYDSPMQRLILFRHGEAQVRAPSGRDIDRALTPAGEATAARAGAALAAAGAAPDLALVSTARRTSETWTAAREAFPASAFEIKPELYNAEAGAILALAKARPEHTVMVIGHNPGLQALAISLLKAQGASAALIARVESRFPPATAAVFSFDPEGRPELDALIMGPVG